MLVIGTGPLGRHTGLEIVAEQRDRRVMGYLTLDGETENRLALKRLPAPVLGAVPTLESVLKQRVVDEVYLASGEESHHAEMQGAIHVCERFGDSPSRSPRTVFASRRAERREAARAVRDGTPLPRSSAQQARPA